MPSIPSISSSTSQKTYSASPQEGQKQISAASPLFCGSSEISHYNSKIKIPIRLAQNSTFRVPSICRKEPPMQLKIKIKLEDCLKAFSLIGIANPWLDPLKIREICRNWTH
jgi:hypothetical protein